MEHGENGWFLDFNSPATFHAALDATLGDPDLRRQLAAAGKKMAADYSIAAVAARVESLYAELIQEERARHHRLGAQVRASRG